MSELSLGSVHKFRQCACPISMIVMISVPPSVDEPSDLGCPAHVGKT